MFVFWHQKNGNFLELCRYTIGDMNEHTIYFQ